MLDLKSVMFEAGRKWAAEKAGTQEREHIAEMLAAANRDGAFWSDDRDSAYDLAEVVAAWIANGSADEVDRNDAAEFWEWQLDNQHPEADDVKSFCEGAASV